MPDRRSLTRKRLASTPASPHPADAPPPNPPPADAPTPAPEPATAPKGSTLGGCALLAVLIGGGLLAGEWLCGKPADPARVSALGVTEPGVTEEVALMAQVKARAHDPRSVDWEGCDRPLEVDGLWRLQCHYRGTNAFGGVVRGLVLAEMDANRRLRILEMR